MYQSSLFSKMKEINVTVTPSSGLMKECGLKRRMKKQTLHLVMLIQGYI